MPTMEHRLEKTYETNNVKYVTILVGPDLTVSSIAAPSSATAGSTISVTDSVRNQGAGDAGPSVTRFYLSNNVLFDSGDVLLPGTRSVPVVAAGATNTGTASVTLPTGLSGIYYIIVVTDGTNTVAEASETNNSAFKGITISRKTRRTRGAVPRRSTCAGASTGGAFGNAPPSHSTVRGSNQRSRSDQTIRGENGESNEVPSVTSIVVMLAVSPPGPP